jgi:hypothetical protein
MRSAPVLLAAVFTAGVSVAASAQPAAPGGIELSVGVVRTGDLSFGSSDATLTTATGSTSRLFSTSTTLMAVTGVEVRAGARITRSVEAAALFGYAKPELATSASNDTEGATPVSATETMTQYVIGGSALWNVSRRAARLTPFISGDVAYLRQLHEGSTVAVNGLLFAGGGGARYYFTQKSSGRPHATGLRGDVRLSGFRKGAAFDSDIHYAPAASIALFVRF